MYWYYLEDYIPAIFDLKDEKSDKVLKKIKVEFTSTCNILSYQYLEFYKDYNKSTFKSLILLLTS